MSITLINKQHPTKPPGEMFPQILFTRLMLSPF